MKKEYDSFDQISKTASLSEDIFELSEKEDSPTVLKDKDSTSFLGQELSLKKQVSSQKGAENQEQVEFASFEPRYPLYDSEDVILNASTQEKLTTLIALIKKHDFLYQVWNLQSVDPQGKCVSVNFYGPPGTGKTMCAEVLAKKFNKKIIDVNYAEIESKFVGETGKNIEKAFRIAKETQSVLFFDEADSILGKRMSQVTQATDHAVNTSRAVMLKQLDHFEGIVVFATNLAENFDKAFVRRILSHIEVGLPDSHSRERLWAKFLMPSVPGVSAVSLSDLVRVSEGMSGGDMKNAFVKACAFSLLENPQHPCLKFSHLEEAAQHVLKANKEVGGVSSLKSSSVEVIDQEEYERRYVSEGERAEV